MVFSIGFIPDGNRRYAREQKIPIIKAYSLGTKKAWQTIEWLKDYPKIKHGVFYTLSLKNLVRKKNELSLLFKIFERELKKVTETGYFEKNDIRLNFIGRIKDLPKSVQESIKQAEEATKEYSSKLITLALGYDGQTEIVDAAKQLALDYEQNRIDLSEVNEDSFRKYLYSSQQPDLIVRTSGEKRLSGFLPYQSTYSELFFCNKYWPEFNQTDLANAINEFNSRKRNFGK